MRIATQKPVLSRRDNQSLILHARGLRRVLKKDYVNSKYAS